jgi:DHA1 family bicyclomycin/chloramphenicol resistance-like MFS transporter
MTAKPGPLFNLALASISLIGPLVVHVFMPVIPAVKADLALSDSLAQLTFSIALLGMALAPLVYGPLSDRYGRRPLLLSGLSLFLAGSLISAAANSVAALVAGRLVQAIGAGCGVTLVRTIAADVYGPSRLIKVIAYLTMFYTLGPMISPVVGGLLIDLMGWRSVFAFALLLGGAIWAGAYFVIFESRPPNLVAQSGWGLVRSFLALFRHARFTGFVLQTGFCTGTFLAAATAAASLMKELLDRPATEFGLYFPLFPLGFLLGNFLSSRIGGRVANETMVLAGSILCLVAVLAQCELLRGGHVAPLALFAPGFFITMAQGISLPYSQAGAMLTNPQLAGTAAGIGVFVQNLCGAAFAQLYGLLADGTLLPLMITTSASGLLGLIAAAVPFALARLGDRE